MATRKPGAAPAGADGKAKPTTVKVVLLGEAAVGKSSIVLRFATDEFQENKEPTIGAAFLARRVDVDNRSIKFEIWDTAGQERFNSLAPMYYRNAQAAIVVYDITNPASLQRAKSWVKELQRQASVNIVIALAGNKVDLASQRAVQPDEVEAYADESGLLFLETSAKDNTNITELFEKIAVALPLDVIEPTQPRRNVDLNSRTTAPPAGGCSC